MSDSQRYPLILTSIEFLRFSFFQMHKSAIKTIENPQLQITNFKVEKNIAHSVLIRKWIKGNCCESDLLLCQRGITHYELRQQSL